MRILIIRHAIAESPGEGTYHPANDDMRPLTKQGRSRMRKGALGLKRITDIDIIGHSPLVRATQTADILGEVFNDANTVPVPELAPGRGPETVAHWLGFVSRQATVAVVGHEPDLSTLVAWLTTGVAAPFLKLKKGGAVLLNCDQPSGPGCAILQWALTPDQLRILAKRGQ